MIRTLLLTMFFSLGAFSKDMRIDYFGAEWCGPCRTTKPHLRKFISKKPNIKVNIYNVDADKEETRKNKITAIPTFIFVLNNKVVGRKTGSMSYVELNCLAHRYFNNSSDDCELPHN